MGNMRILAIVNQKGGVGKTTTAVTLAHGLAAAGRRILLVDLDAQGNVADALGIPKKPGLHRLLSGELDRAITGSKRSNLWVVLSDHQTVEAKQTLAGTMFREYKLRDVLSRFEVYDIAILDTAPGVDVLQIGALVACTHFLIPVALDHLAVVGAADALASTASLHQVGAFTGRCLGVLPTMWERTTTESHQQLEILAGQFKRLVWPPIPRDTKAREAPAHGMTLWEYAPGTRALKGVSMNGAPPVGGYEQVLLRLTREVFGER